MRKDIYKDGVKTQFSSEYQPDNSRKRVPKWKTRIKKALKDHHRLNNNTSRSPP